MSGASPDHRPIGRGLFVAVVGPSGAGKDTVIRAAEAALVGDERYVFPKRLVTRPSSEHEDNVFVSAADYHALKSNNGVALGWEAHGHHYGLPIAIDDAIGAGRIVICNLSRAVIPAARARYAHVLVAEITAPPDILAARLAGRVRASDGDLGKRLTRSVATDVNADVVIQNAGLPEDACDMFVSALRARAEALATS
ncbi:phosphonate metabolism protein/1,5-bisphosphokinase (PRPP-forming) PhnN [Terrarubrum flagellatum]|uniref:phosphonate metabolism protein/1,5-bisphosphokinase (PRPP-forming) PhnN n=1 Tax=Terrirubrum flagellatum TaxID=2895980 RepID=UPI00314508D2